LLPDSIECGAVWLSARARFFFENKSMVFDALTHWEAFACRGFVTVFRALRDAPIISPRFPQAYDMRHTLISMPQNFSRLSFIL
jgi:hypothetical protein